MRFSRAKFLPPPSSPLHVPRERLLRHAGGAPLAWVHAPAGSGKTTLMQHWHARRATEGRRVGWLTLDAADNDLERFVQALRTALAGEAGPAPEAADAEWALDAFETMAAWQAPFSLFVDEFEAIRSDTVRHFLAQWIERLPVHGELVVASRSVAGMPLGRLRARGLVHEVDGTDLRFSLEETADYIRGRRGLRLPDEAIAALQRRTEGWVVALHLATLSLGRRGEPARAVAAFSGSHLGLVEYLSQDILAQQPPAVRDFLLRTSILPRLSAPLCDAVLGIRDSARRLDELAAAGLFVIPLDEQRDSYRYHSLFASFLQGELAREAPEALPALHRRAAGWWLAAGQPTHAIDHLLHAGAQDEALGELARHGGALLEEGRVRLLARWFEQLDPARLRELPRVRLVGAWALVFNRRCEEAMAEVRDVLDTSTGHPEREALAMEAGTIRCMAYNMSDALEAGHRASAELIETIPDALAFHYGTLANVLARALVAAGRYDDARRVLSRAVSRNAHARSSFIRCVADSIEGCIELSQGRLGNARARLQEAADRSLRYDEAPRVGGRASILMVLAVVLYEQDELDAAARIAAQCLPYAREHGTPDALIFGDLLLARIAAARGDHERAAGHLADLEDVGKRMGLARAVATAWLERCRIATLAGDLAGAAAALQAAHGSMPWPPDAAYWPLANEVDTPQIAGWRLDIASGRAQAAVPALREALRRAEGDGRHRRALKLRVLLALGLAALAEPAAATEFETALRIAGNDDCHRCFIDEGPPLAALVAGWWRGGGATAWRGPGASFATRLRDKLGIAPAADAAGGAAEPLTQREMQVLARLAQGDSNRAIADALFVSEATVKTHLRHIYEKLGTTRRTQTLAVARQRGLVA